MFVCNDGYKPKNTLHSIRRVCFTLMAGPDWSNTLERGWVDSITSEENQIRKTESDYGIIRAVLVTICPLSPSQHIIMKRTYVLRTQLNGYTRQISRLQQA